jgi:hypothetical protein
VVQSDAQLPVSLHQFHLPMWRAAVDSRKVTTHPRSDLALVTAETPAGTHRLSFRFGPSTMWLIAAGLALLAAVMWAALAWRIPWLRLAALTLVIVAGILALNGLGVGRRTWQSRPAQATLGDVAQLIGYDVARGQGADALDVTLYWLGLREMETNYKVFVHLLNSDGQVVGQHDGDPVGGFPPTTRWLPGEISPDRHRILLPEGTVGGEYGLKVGMYAPPSESASPTESEPLRNLPVDPPSPDGRVDLGKVIVRPYDIISEP